MSDSVTVIDFLIVKLPGATDFINQDAAQNPEDFNFARRSKVLLDYFRNYAADKGVSCPDAIIPLLEDNRYVVYARNANEMVIIRTVFMGLHVWGYGKSEKDVYNLRLATAVRIRQYRGKILSYYKALQEGICPDISEDDLWTLKSLFTVYRYKSLHTVPEQGKQYHDESVLDWEEYYVLDYVTQLWNSLRNTKCKMIDGRMVLIPDDY